MSTTWRAGAVSAVVALAGCHRQPPAPAQAVTLTQATLAGIVRIVGATPRTHVAVESADGTRVTVVGPLSAELAQLGGAEVTVRGAVTRAEPPDTNGIVMESYEITQVAGGKPIVGRLQREGSAFSVDSMRLESLPSGLAAVVGAKVWVVGRPGKEGLIVTAYGVLATPPR